MFVIKLTYKKPLQIVDQHLIEHRNYLEEGYKNDFFVVSGPQNPRTGGIIISQLENRVQLEEILQQDPFIRENIAEYELIEFSPVKYHAKFVSFISDEK